MSDLDDLEAQFAGDRGNSTLHPSIGDVDAFRKGGFREGTWIHVEWDFLPDDLEALSQALGAVKWDDLDQVQKDDYEAWPRLYASSIPTFPLLGRICDIYRDAIYGSGEIDALAVECVRLQRTSQTEAALRATNKLRLLCRKAQEARAGLILLCD